MPMLNPAHAGEILRLDVLEPLNISITDAASKLGISRKTLSKICNGKGEVTPEMALRLELALGKPSADHWVKLQAAYDLAKVSQRRAELQQQVQSLVA